jgi:hypothetical protein
MAAGIAAIARPFRMRQRTTGRTSFDTREGDWLRFRRMYC